jgi:hypothetical protein
MIRKYAIKNKREGEFKRLGFYHCLYPVRNNAMLEFLTGFTSTASRDLKWFRFQ